MLAKYDPRQGTLELGGRTLNVYLGEEPPALVLQYAMDNPEASEAKIQAFAVRYLEDRIRHLERLLQKGEQG